MLYNPSISTSNIEFSYISGKNWNIQPARFLPPEDGAIMHYKDNTFSWEYPTSSMPGFTTGYGEYTDEGNTNRYAYMQSDNDYVRIVGSMGQLLSFGETSEQQSINLQVHSYNETMGADTTGSYIGGGTDNHSYRVGTVTGGGNSNVGNVCGGTNNQCTSNASHIGGGVNHTLHAYSSAIWGGIGLSASLLQAYHSICGMFNNTNNHKLMVGNGYVDDESVTRSNAFSAQLDIWTPTLYAAEFRTYDGNGDYAEMYESLSGEQIPTGTTVTLDNGYIRECIEGEIPIGVISDTAVFILNAAHDHWHAKYITVDRIVDDTIPITRPVEKSYRKDVQRDGKWYREEVKYMDEEQIHDTVDVYNADGEIIDQKLVPRVKKIGTKIVQESVLNPKFDKSRTYIPRLDRPEWNVVGLLGECKVRHHQIVGPRWILLEEHDKHNVYLVR